MNSSVDAVQKSFADLQQDITANANRLAEAEEHIGDTEDGLTEGDNGDDRRR